MNLPEPQARDLFEYLAGRLVAPTSCDGTLRRSQTWSEKEGLDWPPLERWLQDRGGCCDCEVLLNIAVPVWERDP